MACSRMLDTHKLTDLGLKCHVYLAWSRNKADRQTFNSVRDKLKGQEQNIVIFEGQSDRDDKEDIEQGIIQSQRVVFLLTAEYLKYEHRKFEIRVAVENATATSSDDVLLLVDEQSITDDIFDRSLAKLKTFRKFNLNEILSDRSSSSLISHLADVVTQDHVLQPNMGAAFACSYYHNYLKKILPGLKHRAEKQVERSSMLMKLVIIIRESLTCVKELSELSPCIERQGQVECRMDQAGKEGRCYDTPLYRIKSDRQTPQDPQEFQIMAEMPSILETMPNMRESGIPIGERRLRLELKQFCTYLTDLLDKDPECTDTYVVFYYFDRAGVLQPFENALFSKVEEEMKAQTMEEKEPHQDDHAEFDAEPPDQPQGHSPSTDHGIKLMNSENSASPHTTKNSASPKGLESEPQGLMSVDGENLELPKSAKYSRQVSSDGMLASAEGPVVTGLSQVEASLRTLRMVTDNSITGASPMPSDFGDTSPLVGATAQPTEQPDVRSAIELLEKQVESLFNSKAHMKAALLDLHSGKSEDAKMGLEKLIDKIDSDMKDLLKEIDRLKRLSNL